MVLGCLHGLPPGPLLPHGGVFNHFQQKILIYYQKYFFLLHASISNLYLRFAYHIRRLATSVLIGSVSSLLRAYLKMIFLNKR